MRRATATAETGRVIPETRYSKSADGVHIAYQVLGDADLDLVLSPGLRVPPGALVGRPRIWPGSFDGWRSFSRLIVFDKRGTGMSDRPPDDRPALLEDRVNDIASLMDTVGSERAAIMGLSETGAVALLFAATYPERTRAVVAYGTFAGEGDTGPLTRGSPIRKTPSGSRTWSGTGAGALVPRGIRAISCRRQAVRGLVRQARATLGEPWRSRGVGSDDDPDGRARRPPHYPCPDARPA